MGNGLKTCKPSEGRGISQRTRDLMVEHRTLSQLKRQLGERQLEIVHELREIQGGCGDNSERVDA